MRAAPKTGAPRTAATGEAQDQISNYSPRSTRLGGAPVCESRTDPVSAALTLELRPYQLEAIDRVRCRLRSCRRVLLVAPTGAGKTVIAARVVSSAHGRQRCVLFFAHRRELIAQTYSKLLAAGVPELDLGVMMADDRRTRPSAPIQIASIDTWRHRAPPPADLVIIDEAHRSLAATYLRAIEHYSAASAVVLGLSATPYRSDNRGLGDVYEALEVVSQPRELIAQGFLVEPKVFSVARKPDLSGVRVRGGDYVESDLAEVCNTPEHIAAIIEHWQRLAEGRRTVVFAVGVAHSKAIAAAFVQAGITAEHLDGSTATAERDAILARLASGETLVVANCGVLAEGWDQPPVKCCVLARPTKSLGLYLQQGGRVLRPWEGVGALILDHGGCALKHGLPQDDRVFTLETTKPTEPTEPPTKECSECGAVVPLNTRDCPECGHVFEARRPKAPTKPRELVEITPDYERAERKRRARLGLASVKQARILAHRGLNPDVPFELASEAITAIAENGWRTPRWLLSDPRFVAESIGVAS